MRIIEWLAFLAPALTVAPKATQAETESPYPSHWKQKPGQLDIRPAIKSLIEHPEDWRMADDDQNTVLQHIPSKHEFWVYGDVHLWRAPSLDGQQCSCVNQGRSHNIHKSQKKAFWQAYRAWREPVEARRHAAINKQFASHFNATP